MQLGKCFGTMAEENTFHKFLNLQQDQLVKKHYGEYEHLSTYLPKLQDVVIENTYMKGLKPKIQTELACMAVVRLMEIMDASIEVEQCTRTLWEAWDNHSPRSFWQAKVAPSKFANNRLPLWYSE